MKILLFFIVIFFVSCGQKPKTIEEEVLKSIIYDAVFTDVVLSSQSREISRDSIQYFASILKKHDCTIEDFEYTVGKMALRKSNILPTMISELFDEVEIRKENYKYTAKIVQKWDERADSIYTKEIFIDSMDVTHRDSLEKLVFTYDIKEPGELEVKYSYLIDTLDDNSSHVLTVTYKDTISNKTKSARSSWLYKSKAMKYKRDSIKVKLDDEKYHQVIIKFLEIKQFNKKEIKKPYVYFDTMQILYHHPKLTSRKMLLDSAMHAGSFKNKIEKFKNAHLDTTVNGVDSLDRQLIDTTSRVDTLTVVEGAKKDKKKNKE